MDTINCLKDNTKILETFITSLLTENNDLKNKLTNLQNKYNDLEKESKQQYNVSIVKNFNTQINELKAKNTMLENQLSKYKKNNEPKKEYDVIEYKNVEYLIDPETDDIFESDDGSPGKLVAKLVNGKFKKIK
jgi:hypothetical protein